MSADGPHPPCCSRRPLFPSAIPAAITPLVALHGRSARSAYSCSRLEPVPDIWHRLNVVAEEAQMGAERMNVPAERLDGDQVARRADGRHDAVARESLVGPRSE